jgi:hypothetical protein
MAEIIYTGRAKPTQRESLKKAGVTLPNEDGEGVAIGEYGEVIPHGGVDRGASIQPANPSTPNIPNEIDENSPSTAKDGEVKTNVGKNPSATRGGVSIGGVNKGTTTTKTGKVHW